MSSMYTSLVECPILGVVRLRVNSSTHHQMMLKETGKPKSKDKDKQKKKVAFTAVEEESSDCDEEDEGIDAA